MTLIVIVLLVCDMMHMQRALSTGIVRSLSRKQVQGGLAFQLSTFIYMKRVIELWVHVIIVYYYCLLYIVLCGVITLVFIYYIVYEHNAHLNYEL